MRRSLASTSSLAVTLGALFAVGCTGTLSGDDAGAAGDDAGASVDAGTADAGGGEDAGPDAGPTDPPDAGPTDPPDGGPVDEEDAGCPLVDPCDGVPVTGAVTFAHTSTTNSFGPGAASLAVGAATRADVDAAFGAAVSTDNPFRSWHCSHGVRVEYVDDLAGADFEGGASAADVVARVVTLDGVNLTNDTGVVPGDTRTSAQAALTSPVSVDLAGIGFDASASDGQSVTSDAGGLVTAVALFAPQTSARWDLPIDIAGAAIGAAPAELAVGDDLDVADGVLGSAYEAQGIVAVDIGITDLDFLVRIYAAFGVRVVARCPLSGSCDPSNAEVQQIILSPPFVGSSSGGLGIGSAEPAFVTALGAGEVSSESDDLMKYEGGGGEPLGVAYITDSACERRAAALLLNYSDPP